MTEHWIESTFAEVGIGEEFRALSGEGSTLVKVDSRSFSLVGGDGHQITIRGSARVLRKSEIREGEEPLGLEESRPHI